MTEPSPADIVYAELAPPPARRQPKLLLAGQITTAIVLQPSATMNVWGIRLHPWAAGAFLGVPAAELRDRVISLGELSGSLARELNQAGERIGDDEHFDFLVQALTAHLSSMARPDARMSQLVDYVVGGNVDYSVRGLATEVGLSAPRVDGMFRSHVGLSPKQLLRITRFQRALSLRRTMPSLSWAAIALRAGYYDQAHLAHQARTISGVAATDLLRISGGLTEIFLSPDT
jgi:AraC-like DNA-binding protein